MALAQYKQLDLFAEAGRLAAEVGELDEVTEVAKRLESLILEDSRRLLLTDPVATVEALLRLAEDARAMQRDLIAEKMHVSIRKLTGILRRRGTSFRILREKVLKERCQQLMDKGVLNGNDLTELLGYADPSHFYVLFQRWMGHGFKAELIRRKALDLGLASAGEDAPAMQILSAKQA